MTYYAKSPQRDGTQETVREHTQKVKVLAQTYGKSFGEEISAGLCGVFHDFGKYSSAFQQVLQGTRTGVDHAIAGAVFLYGLRKKALHPIIEVVAAHHSHLDGGRLSSVRIGYFLFFPMLVFPIFPRFSLASGCFCYFGVTSVLLSGSTKPSSTR